jgi:hypothetical protein
MALQLLENLGLEIGAPEDADDIEQAVDGRPIAPSIRLRAEVIHLQKQMFQAQESANPFV